jgi:hypothetical protein
MKKPRHKIVPLGQSKKKPSALLVYLALESAGRLKPMNREDIVKYINDNYGVHIEPKTVTEASSVLKSLSSGPKPIIDFHSHGKNGYQLGNAKSPLSQGQILQILASLSEVAPNSVQPTLASLAPLMNEEDLKMIKGVIAMMPERKEVTSGFDQTVFDTMEYIIEAYNDKKSIIFNHRFIDMNGGDMKTTKDVILVPYYLFSKNGRYYLLGGKMGDEESEPALYIADLEHMDQVGVNDNQADDLPMSVCTQGRSFDFQRFLQHEQRIYEGKVGTESSYCISYLAEIIGEHSLLLTMMMYPDAVEMISSRKLDHPMGFGDTVYTVRLRFDSRSAIEWAFRFSQAGKLLFKNSGMDKILKNIIASQARKALRKYDPDFKLPAETKKND